ncbi:hypothetical protein [Arthrobacter sp. efr-133-R2A-63]
MGSDIRFCRLRGADLRAT